MKGGGTPFWKLNNTKDRIVLRTIKEFNELKSGFTKNLNPSTQLFIAKLGKKCIDNTIKLIEHYKPKYWYIENPKSSLMWKYIKLNKLDFVKKNKVHFNVCSYGKYGFLIRKDTIFLSNVKMSLSYGAAPRIYHTEYEEVNLEEVNKNIKKWPKFYIKKNGKWYKKWYVTNGHTYKDGPKYATLFAKDAGLGKLQKIDDRSKYQKVKKTTKQICESGSASHIPSSLIKEIFSFFRVK